MAKCTYCGNEDNDISSCLEICRECILNTDWKKVKPHLEEIHSAIRQREDLPPHPPHATKAQTEYSCNLCINSCVLSQNDTSYCGLRNYKKNKQAKLPNPSKKRAYMHGYLDSNPTNCCNSWFCPAGSSDGYPKYSAYDGPEYGTYSYAAFLYGCTFNCLFCQNASHKHFSKPRLVGAEDIAEQISQNEKITCLCYFGGTPEPQLPFTIHLAKLILEKIEKIDKERKFRVCWEWNGSGRQDLVEECMEIALKTGGNIKFDLKSWYEQLNIALCGISNQRTLDNFEYLARNNFGSRENLPELSGCTLLVPGYVTSEDIEKIAQFIANINPEIPYSLLVFHPDYMMNDLPFTSKEQAYECLEVAEKYLKHVHLGNQFLLK